MKLLLLALVALVLCTGAAASPTGSNTTPTGHFTMTPSATPLKAGDTMTYVITDLKGVNKNYEVTLGTWCDPPIQWGPFHVPTINEFSTFGTSAVSYPYVLTLPSTGAFETCHSRLIAAYWFKGAPQQAWTLDGPKDFSFQG